MTPIKVSFVIGSLALGGAEMQLVRLVNGLDRSRFSPSIICLWEGDDLERAVAPDVAISTSRLAPGQRFRGRRVVMAVRILAELAFKLRRQRPEIVHAYLPAAYVLGGLTAWALRVPWIIASRRGLTSFETAGAGRWFSRIANHVIDIQICNSNAVRDWAIAKERLPVERTRVIHNGIDLPALESTPKIPNEWISGGAMAAMVANFIPYKGHRNVLRAVAKLAQIHPSFRLVLIGEGRERAALIDLSRKLGIVENIIFAGKRTNAAELLPAFDFTVLGSSEEGFPNAVMESMACAVPVVATAVGGVVELVEDGIHGRLVAFDDHEAMARAMIWMIEHPEEGKRMGLNGRNRIAREFSTQRMVAQTQDIYQELLGHQRGAQAATS